MLPREPTPLLLPWANSSRRCCCWRRRHEMINSSLFTGTQNLRRSHKLAARTWPQMLFFMRIHQYKWINLNSFIRSAADNSNGGNGESFKLITAKALSLCLFHWNAPTMRNHMSTFILAAMRSLPSRVELIVEWVHNSRTRDDGVGRWGAPHCECILCDAPTQKSMRDKIPCKLLRRWLVGIAILASGFCVIWRARGLRL